MQELIVCFSERPGAARESRGALRELQRELRFDQLASVVIVVRPAVDDIHFKQDGDVGPWSGGCGRPRRARLRADRHAGRPRRHTWGQPRL